MILKLYNLTGIHPKMYQPGGKIELIVDEMVSTAEETRCVWEIPDLQVLLQSPNQASTASKPVSDLDHTKKMVKGVKIFWNEIDKLLFSSLTFCLTVDAKGVEPKRLMRSILDAVRPIRLLVDSFNGLSTELSSYSGPRTPFLIYLGAECSNDEIDMLFKNLLAIKKTQYSASSVSQPDQARSLHDEILKLTPLASLPLGSTSVLTALVQYSKIFSFIGYWKQDVSGLKHHFIITMSADKKLLIQQPDDPPTSEPFFSISYFGSGSVEDPNYGPGYLIRLVSITVWLRYLKLNVKKNKRFRELREKVRKSLAEGDRNALREDLLSLNEEGSSDVHLHANIAEFRAELVPEIMPILNQDEQSSYEVPITSSFGARVLSDHRYIRGMNASIVAKLNELQQMLDERIMEYEKIQTHVANMVNLEIEKINHNNQKVNLDIQKAVTRLTKIAVVLAGIAIIVEIVVAYIFRS
jgi:hypothetical protein